MRRALAEQIRRPLQALAAGGNLGRGLRSARRSSGRQRRSPCSQRRLRPARLGYAHHVPQARNRVAEGVQAALGIFGRRGGGGKDHAGGADGGRDGARLQNAHAHRARALIARAGGNRRSRRQAGQPRGLLADARADLRRLIELRQPALSECRPPRPLRSTSGDASRRAAACRRPPARRWRTRR